MFKLLLVDDEPIEREGMKAILERSFEGIEIKQAKNGKMAVEIAADWQPDIIFMDIMMPIMTGLEAIEQIRETDPDVEFVMMTAFDTFDYAQRAIKLGVERWARSPAARTSGSRRRIAVGSGCSPLASASSRLRRCAGSPVIIASSSR